MEQNTEEWNRDESDVMGILSELPELIAKSEKSSDQGFWGFQRRIFAVSDGSARPMVVEPEEQAVQATTPVTRLSHSHSEPDENHDCSKRRSSHNKTSRHHQPSNVDQTAHGQSPPAFHTPDLNVSPPPSKYSVQASPGCPYLAYVNRATAEKNWDLQS